MPADKSITERASSFGAQAAAYATHRPDYPLAAVRWALEPVTGSTPPRVLDLGAGTGKLTGVIAAAGAEVTAVEPDEAMRAELSVRHPGVTALAGTAESIPLPAASVDAVLVGQAFHWFDHQRALPEIGRVLRPGGVLAALWNDDDLDVDWVAGYKAVYKDEPIGMAGSGTELAIEFGPFAEEQQATFRHSMPRTAESLVATVATHSIILVMSEQERTEVLGRVLDYLRSRPETARGEFALPMITVAVRASRV